GLIQETAGIASQIENQLSHSLRTQFLHCFAQLIVARSLEATGQADIAGTRTNDVSVTNRWERTRIENHRKVHRLLCARSIDFDRDWFTLAAAYVLRHLFAGPLARVFTINFQNSITIAQPESSSRRPFYSRLNINTVAV